MKLNPAGQVQVVIGEIKALSSSKVFAALDETIDGHLQMSINWLRGHAELVADMLISAINMALNIALTSANLGGAATWVKNASDRGEIDLYLLRARYYGSDDWKLQGYKLPNLRTKGSGETASVMYRNHRLIRRIRSKSVTLKPKAITLNNQFNSQYLVDRTS